MQKINDCSFSNIYNSPSLPLLTITANDKTNQIRETSFQSLQNIKLINWPKDAKHRFIKLILDYPLKWSLVAQSMGDYWTAEKCQQIWTEAIQSSLYKKFIKSYSKERFFWEDFAREILDLVAKEIQERSHKKQIWHDVANKMQVLTGQQLNNEMCCKAWLTHKNKHLKITKRSKASEEEKDQPSSINSFFSQEKVIPSEYLFSTKSIEAIGKEYAIFETQIITAEEIIHRQYDQEGNLYQQQDLDVKKNRPIKKRKEEPLSFDFYF